MKEVLKKFILEEELSTSKTINDILGEHIEIPKDKTIIDILDTIDLCDYGLDLSSRDTRTLIFLDLEKIVLLNTNSERLILLLNEDIEVFSSESVSFEDIERIKDKYIYRDRVLLKLKALKWVNLPLQLTMKDYQYQFSQFLEPLNYSKYLEKDLLEIKIEIIHLLKASISNIDLDIEDEYSRTIESILGVSLIMNDLKYESHKTKPSNADFLPIEIMKILNKPAINFLSTNKIYALSGENFAEGLKSKIIYDKKLSILKFLCSLKLLDRTIDKLDKDKLKTRFSELRRILLSITQPMYDKSGAFPELENIETNIPKRRRDLIQKSLKFLVSHNILQKNDDVYKLNFLHWFKQQRYRLSTNNFLDDLIPLLASFIKYNSSNKVDVFLNHIDNIIGRILKAPKNQSAYANMENYIIEIINRDYYREELYTISYFTSDVSNNISKKSFEKLNTYKEVVLKQLFFNDDGKKILKITTSTDLDVDIFIERVYKLNAKSTDINAVSTKDGKSFVVYNDIYAQIINNTNYINLFSQAMKTNNKKNNQAITEQYRMNQSFYDAVLEVDTNLSESFDVKLLNKQKTYQTLNEKIDFLDNGLDDFFTNVDDEDKNNIKNGIKRSLESSISTNSKFYVTTLKEERDQLLDTLYSHKDNISILYPMELKKDYFEELKLAQEQIKL